MRKGRQQTDPLGGDEQMMPFISIAFLLLIFCLIAGAIESRAPVPLEPPRGEGSESTASSLPPLYLAKDGSLWFDGKQVAEEALGEALKPYREAGEEDLRLQIKADAASDSALLVTLLARLRALGVAQTEIMTEAP